MSDSFILASEEAPQPAGRRKVLITGAAGNIGVDFARRYAGDYDLRLMVRSDGYPPELGRVGEVVHGDVGDLGRMKALCQGVDTVVHLAASALPDTPWEPLLRNNIVGTYNTFVAAEVAGCRRVVFASSIHAISGYPATRQVHADDPPSPGDLYGVSKCFGEAMGRFMATQRGLSVIVIRIGAFQPITTAKDPKNLGLLDGFISQDDMAQLLQRCIDDRRLRFAIVHGLSDNAFNRMDITETMELLGYAPKDDFARHNPRLRDLNLHARMTHSEEGGQQKTGLREQL